MLELAPIPTSKACLSTPLLPMQHTMINKATPVSFLLHRPYRRPPLISTVRHAAWRLLLTIQTLDLLTSCLDNPRKLTHSLWPTARAQPNTHMATTHDESFQSSEHDFRNLGLMSVGRAALELYSPTARGFGGKVRSPDRCTSTQILRPSRNI